MSSTSSSRRRSSTCSGSSSTTAGSCSRATNYSSVWGYTFAGDTRTVDVHVRQLRRKLGEACPIVTVWGVGYKVSTEPKVARLFRRAT